MHKHWVREASFTDFIISYLLSCRSLKIQKKILYELVQKRRRLSKEVFNNNLYRLRKKGVIDFNKNKDITINKNALRLHTLYAKIKTIPVGDQKVIVFFDIPEKKRKTRNWLRLQLKQWDFELLQQSVWLGKGPLPKEFNFHLKMLGISECVKVFQVRSTKI